MSSTNFNISSDRGASASVIMQYPFIMHVGHNIYSMDKAGVVTFVKRASKAASGCSLSIFCYPPGSPNLKLEVVDPTTVKLKGYNVALQQADSDILSFTRT
jgi:hypothetical protein